MAALLAPPVLPKQRQAPKAPSRDNFIDVLRIFSIGLVVLQHWLMPVLAYQGGHLTTANALSAPGAWIITWISQVMPLVFFAGGAANAMSLRKDRPASAWLGDRLRRLAWPILPLAVVWLPLPHLLGALPAEPVQIASKLVGQLLWFEAAYLIAVALTPLMVWLHERYGWRVVALLGAGAMLIDVLRFQVAEPIGYLNVLFVWMAVHQLGILYARGARFKPMPMALAGFGIVAALVAFGPYPGSMIGMPGAPMSNMAPPTVVMLALAFGQLGLALLLKPALLRLAARPKVAAVLTAVAPRTMTIYLWHMTALVVVAGVAVVGLHLATPAAFSGAWLLGMPVWLGSLFVVMGWLVRAFGRFEAPPKVLGAVTLPRVVLGVVLIGGGLLGLTLFGFVAGLAPVLSVAAVGGGLAAGWPRRAR